jgi:hypothetical protein
MDMEEQIGRAGTSVIERIEGYRRTERVKVSLPVRVCSNGEAGVFDEICKTLNASCDGLYFLSEIESYRVGMYVVVTFPYSYATKLNVRFYGKVVRIDRLSGGQFGIAVELIVTEPLHADALRRPKGGPPDALSHSLVER